MGTEAIYCVLCLDYANSQHHIVPKSAGGLDTEDNKAPLCVECHDMVTPEWEKWADTIRLRKEQIRNALYV